MVRAAGVLERKLEAAAEERPRQPADGITLYFKRILHL
jgi:hypothetical protein